MRVAVLTTHVPFVRGGAEELADSLVDALARAGHDARHVRMPFKWYPPQSVAEHMLAARLTEIEDADLVIGMKFPAYLVRHPNKILWLAHQHRQVYDFWGTPYQDIPATPPGLAIRDAIMRADAAAFAESRAVFTISRTTAERMERFNGVTPEVLYPPLSGRPGAGPGGPQGDYLFVPGRLSEGKRQHLALEALARTGNGLRLVVAGAPETPADGRRAREIVHRLGLDDRVELHDRWISYEERNAMMRGALGCVYVPYDEDLGYVTLEAFHAGKPVITCTDSGGPLEFVDDGVTGLVATADPAHLGAAYDRLHRDRRAAARMGEEAARRFGTLQLDWAHVVERLLAAAGAA